MTSANNAPTGRDVMKSQVQIALAGIVAITLMTTGIVYANDDLMTEIENAIKSLQQADKQHDKQFKKLTKQVKELQQQNGELQQQHENQQDKIKRLKDFRDNALTDMQTMHDDLDANMTPTTTPPDQTMMEGDTPTTPPDPEPIHTPITITKSNVTRGDNLEFIINFESMPNYITVNGVVNDAT